MSTGRRYYGVYLATVVATDDDEGLGRIRLDADQFSDTSDDPLWATVVRPLAGNGPTVFFTPKEGDQVLISFLAGNPRDPVVLGYAHSTERKPEDVSETKHAIVTQAGRVTFDEDGSIEVKLASGNTSIRLDSEGIHLSHNGVSTLDLTAAGIQAQGLAIDLTGPVTATPSISSALVSAGTLAFGAGGASSGSMQMPAGGLDIESPASGDAPFTVDGEPVVVETFLTRHYIGHQHTADGSPTSPPRPPPDPSDVLTDGSTSGSP